MYELDDTGVRRRHQGPVILRGIRGGAGDEVQNEFQNECPQTTEEPNPRDDRDAEEYSGNMSEYLELEDLLEATRNDFDERQSHCDGSLLREALVLNERIRLRRDYRELKECLDQQIRILGLEPEELDAEEMHRPGRSGISAGRNEMYAGRPPPWRRRRARSQRPVQSLDQ
ncbi:uncharacterized protein A1O5_09497 [Cladophialophora psammophila CBS 110553]|uniref:Uncharacterized protein n=1 Tax=Cladophialophora psammophila CBS 110553 TaxID=1182543 RepID=W9XAL6_9EURO|nr:uncharacterized protein A1O5_09497 [Cladophialophora psammophila CBS 110553]EXJ67484.1 hypothetical protein A1O5_09497 [Cladophialophora psammophila CBS 110553]